MLLLPHIISDRTVFAVAGHSFSIPDAHGGGHPGRGPPGAFTHTTPRPRRRLRRPAVQAFGLAFAGHLRRRHCRPYVRSSHHLGRGAAYGRPPQPPHRLRRAVPRPLGAAAPLWSRAALRAQHTRQLTATPGRRLWRAGLHAPAFSRSLGRYGVPAWHEGQAGRGLGTRAHPAGSARHGRRGIARAGTSGGPSLWSGLTKRPRARGLTVPRLGPQGAGLRQMRRKTSLTLWYKNKCGPAARVASAVCIRNTETMACNGKNCPVTDDMRQ